MPEYQSNVQSVMRDLIVDVKTTLNPRTISRVGSEQLIGDLIRRIHQQGLDAGGGTIGQYSSKPMYVSLTTFVRKKGKVGKSEHGKPIKGQRTLKAKGKNSDSTKFKNGKLRKSRYFPDGYMEYHDEMGNGRNVNLTLTGQLSNDLKVSNIGNNFGLGFSDYGMEIYKGLENHFSVIIWMATKDEEDRVIVALEEYIDKNLTK